MWLFTRYGFYSIACGQQPNGATDLNTMMIRARSVDHLQNLKVRFPVLSKTEILTLAKRDYRWRLIVPKQTWAGIVAEIVQEQEWSNFKSEAARFQGAKGLDYVHALHKVWQVMYGIQEKSVAKPVA
jgi:hypothetical protein